MTANLQAAGRTPSAMPDRYPLSQSPGQILVSVDRAREGQIDVK